MILSSLLKIFSKFMAKKFYKISTRTHLANFSSSRLMIQGPHSQHFIFFVTYEETQQATLFVPVKLYHPSVM